MAGRVSLWEGAAEYSRELKNRSVHFNDNREGLFLPHILFSYLLTVLRVEPRTFALSYTCRLLKN